MKLIFQLAALLTIILTPASADIITIISASSIANAPKKAESNASIRSATSESSTCSASV